MKLNAIAPTMRMLVLCFATAAVPCVAGAQAANPTLAAELPPAPEPNFPQAANSQAQNNPDQSQDRQKSEAQGQPQNPNSPSIGDLGFTPEQTKPNTQLQAMLDKRTHMLKIHQRLGIITAIPMAAALITGPMAKARGRNGQIITEPTQANLDIHAALGATTTALYFSTAYFAVLAPKVPGVQRRGAIRLHRALAFAHGTGMIATPVLGALAFKQEQAGEKVHGIASAHGTVAWTTALAYGTAIISVSWPLKVHF